VRNSPVYTIIFTSISNLVPLFCTFNLIYIKNSFSFNFILLNHLIKDILILTAFITLIFASKAALLLYS